MCRNIQWEAYKEKGDREVIGSGDRVRGYSISQGFNGGAQGCDGYIIYSNFHNILEGNKIFSRRGWGVGFDSFPHGLT